MAIWNKLKHRGTKEFKAFFFLTIFCCAANEKTFFPLLIHLYILVKAHLGTNVVFSHYSPLSLNHSNDVFDLMWATAERFTPCHRSARPFRIFLLVIVSQALGWCSVSRSPGAENETQTCKIYIFIYGWTLSIQAVESEDFCLKEKYVRNIVEVIINIQILISLAVRAKYLCKREVSGGKCGWSLHSGPFWVMKSAVFLPPGCQLLLSFCWERF